MVPFMGAGQVIAPNTWYRHLIVAGLFFAESWIAIFIHELGHAVAARLVGRRVHVFSVHPFAFSVKARRFVPTKQFATGDVGGFVLATPRPGGSWRRGEKTFILGGVGANWASCAVAFGFAASGTLSAPVEAIVGAFAVLSLVVGLINLVPTWPHDRLRSDGAHFLDVLRGRHNPVLERLTWLVAMHVDGGVKATDLNRDLTAQIENDIRDGSIPAGALALLLTHYLTIGDLTHAHAIIKRIVITDNSDAVKIDHAFIIAMVERNGPRALAVLDAIAPAARGKSYNYWRALAVAREAAGDLEGARAAAELARVVAGSTNAPLDDQDWALLDTLDPSGAI